LECGVSTPLWSLGFLQSGYLPVSFAGHVMVNARMRLDEGTDPIHVDYQDRSASGAGAMQLGIPRWDGDHAVFCMAASGQPRPDAFTSKPGSGRTLSQWRPKPV
jgi:hypothetical protein